MELGYIYFPSSIEEYAILSSTKKNGYLVFTILVGAISYFIGGYINALYCNNKHYKNVLVFGILSFFVDALSYEFNPFWASVASLALTIPMSLLGCLIFKKKKCLL